MCIREERTLFLKQGKKKDQRRGGRKVGKKGREKKGPAGFAQIRVPSSIEKKGVCKKQDSSQILTEAVVISSRKQFIGEGEGAKTKSRGFGWVGS